MRHAESTVRNGTDVADRPGLREDLERFVHGGSLVSMWPRLRRLLGPHARREWGRQLIAPTSR